MWVFFLLIELRCVWCVWCYLDYVTEFSRFFHTLPLPQLRTDFKQTSKFECQKISILALPGLLRRTSAISLIKANDCRRNKHNIPHTTKLS